MSIKLLHEPETEDPILSVVNLIDIFLVIIAALLVLFWLLVKRCQEYSAPRKVSRVFSAKSSSTR